METITRKDALERGLKRYFTGEPCKHGHVCERFCSVCCCVECLNENSKKYIKKNRGKKREYHRKYRKENLEKEKERNRKWKEEKKSKASADEAIAMIASLSKLSSLK